MRVLFLTHRLPYAPNRGDRIRAYHLLRTLSRQAAVDLVSLAHDLAEADRAADLAPLAVSVSVARVSRARTLVGAARALVDSVPLTHRLLASPRLGPLLKAAAARRPDVVLAYCSGMARFALEPPLAGLPLVIDLVDVDSAKWGALAAASSPPLAWVYRREAACLARFERAAAERAVATVVVNEREREVFRRVAPGARVEVIPSGVDFEYFRSPDGPGAGRDVVFCGVMNYRPNEEGALWLAREVWPHVRARHPDARLWLVGSHPTRQVLALRAADGSVEVTGAVADVRPYLWRAAVAAAPLHTARGLQNKVLEAVAAGLPAIVTPAVAEGLPEEVLPACRVAHGAKPFADALCAWLAQPPEARRRLADAARVGDLHWDRRLAPMVDLLRAAAQRGAVGGKKSPGEATC